MASVLCIGGLVGVGVDAESGGACAGVGIGAGAEVEALEGALALALRDPGNVMEGPSGFQQFFLI